MIPVSTLFSGAFLGAAYASPEATISLQHLLSTLSFVMGGIVLASLIATRIVLIAIR